MSHCLVVFRAPSVCECFACFFLACGFLCDFLFAFLNLDRFGNTSAASIPLAFSEAVSLGKVHSGDKVLMVAFGGGLSWGGAVVEWL